MKPHAILLCSFAAWCLACSGVGRAGLPRDAPVIKALDHDIIFAVRRPGKDGHWYANFSYYAEGPQRVTYTEGGRLCRLNPQTGALTILLDDPKGGIRDPQVHYDGQKILFSYRPGGSTHFHLFEINIDGSGLKRLTDGDCDDIEPSYLPDGGIVFVSSRCNRWVNCWLTQVAVLYRCDGDGGNIQMLSSNNEHENTPSVLPDGRVLYQRWEYVDRSQVNYHHLWTTNPDGTGQMVYYGNMHPGVLMIDAKPLPNSRKVVSIFSPGHGRREHAGKITIVDPGSGPDHKPSAHTINEDASFRDPFPLDDHTILAARNHELMVMDLAGRTQTVYQLPEAERKEGYHVHEPFLIRSRAREHVIPPRVNKLVDSGQLILADVYAGRNMQGIKRGDIKELLVLESLPKPINYTGGMEPLSYGGTFTLERVLGTVPVEADGSAYLDIPALRSVFFVALDHQGLSVKRMQSFTTVQPGEVTSCMGCHEQRTQSPVKPTDLMALKRPPSPITPVPGVPDVFDFPRDIQPILDAHCVSCHDYEKTASGGPRAGGVILSGDRGPMYSHSYYMLTVLRLFSDGRNQATSNYTPRSLGSAASRILQMIDGSHYGAKASDQQRTALRLWIDSGAPYPGTYAALGSGMIGGHAENKPDRSDLEWPAVQEAMQVYTRRCDGCHNKHLPLPRSLSDNRKMPPWAVKYGDVRLRMSRHILYNLTRPEKSLLLLAPLAKEAGGLGLCKTGFEQEAPASVPVFDGTSDSDYQKLLAAVQAGQARLNDIKRFDMPGFQPPAAYLREMKRYGILGEQHSVDPYATDQAYWRSLWYQPGK